MPRWSASTQSGVTESIVGETVVQREQFAADELKAVLEQYDLGSIDSVQEFARGSRRSPKAVITTPKGKFLLKRRASGKNDPRRVAFSHSIQLHLAEHHFPLPRLIGTKVGRQTFFQSSGNIYELFDFIHGHTYPGTLEATEDAGRVLAQFHQLLLDFSPPWHPAASTGYHQSQIVLESVKRIQAAGQIAQEVLSQLQEMYSRASAQTKLENWPKQIVHADWHPGNLLFQHDHVLAVLDYDAARD
ncbi:MAG TPA: phosphotransferase, partial [Tepidisphaeraceae bacterium]|nr:phosphotransferase [Tepidisphaeraceae bacterium]